MSHCNPETGDERDLNWFEKGFEDFKMVAIDTIGDGSCYFHAFLHAFSIPYKEQKLNNQTIDRRDFVKNMRMSLSKKLGSPINPLYPSGPTYYNELSRGKMYEFGQEVPEYSFEEMSRRLRSSEAVGNEFNEFVSNQFNKDIYILNEEIEDVYVTGKDDDILYKGRPSVVLLYSSGDSGRAGHYELVGLKDSNNITQTYFSSTHPFIQFLRARMDS